MQLFDARIGVWLTLEFPSGVNYLLGIHNYLWNLRKGLLKPIIKYGNAEIPQHITVKNTKGTFEINVAAVANTSIHWLSQRSLCQFVAEWQMGQAVLMSRAESEGNFLFPSFSKSLSAAQPPPPRPPLLGPDTLAGVNFPPLLKQSSLTCRPACFQLCFRWLREAVHLPGSPSEALPGPCLQVCGQRPQGEWAHPPAHSLSLPSYYPNLVTFSEPQLQSALPLRKMLQNWPSKSLAPSWMS